MSRIMVRTSEASSPIVVYIGVFAASCFVRLAAVSESYNVCVCASHRTRAAVYWPKKVENKGRSILETKSYKQRDYMVGSTYKGEWQLNKKHGCSQ